MPRQRILLAVTASCWLLAAPAAAQEGWTLLPYRVSLPRPMAAPREPALGGKLVLTDGMTRFGPVVEGEAMLGGGLAVLAFGGASELPRFTLGLEGGVFARFNMETRQKDLIASDWVFGLPLVLRRGEDWLRFRYRHQSSHLGDEYLARFDETRIPYNRDAFDVTAYRRIRPLVGAYAGGSWAVFAEPGGSGRWVVWGGAELEMSPHASSARPYIAVDVRLDQDTEWDPALNLQAGLHLFASNGRSDTRVVLELFAGPAPVGQFYQTRTTSVALGGIISR